MVGRESSEKFVELRRNDPLVIYKKIFDYALATNNEKLITIINKLISPKALSVSTY